MKIIKRSRREVQMNHNKNIWKCFEEKHAYF